MIPIEGKFSDFERAEQLRDRIMEKVTQLEAIVASINGRWNEDIPLIQTFLEDWRRMLESRLNAHFIAARTILATTPFNPIGGATSSSRTIHRDGTTPM